MMSDVAENPSPDQQASQASADLRQIYFYHLMNGTLEATVASLAEKAQGVGKKLLILTSEQQASALSDALWAHNPNSFLAHGLNQQEMEAAKWASVWIATNPFDNPIEAEFILLTFGLTPEKLDSFERVFNLFDGRDEEAVIHARQQWKIWSAEEAVACRYYNQSENGKWQRKV